MVSVKITLVHTPKIDDNQIKFYEELMKQKNKFQKVQIFFLTTLCNRSRCGGPGLLGVSTILYAEIKFTMISPSMPG